MLIEEPAYEPLVSLAAYLGARIRRFPRRLSEGFAIDPADIEKAITTKTRLILITNLHNPWAHSPTTTHCAESVRARSASARKSS